ncbi:hypothetical protein D3C71_1070860 [compost metagenome]
MKGTFDIFYGIPRVFMLRQLNDLSKIFRLLFQQLTQFYKRIYSLLLCQNIKFLKDEYTNLCYICAVNINQRESTSLIVQSDFVFILIMQK